MKTRVIPFEELMAVRDRRRRRFGSGESLREVIPPKGMNNPGRVRRFTCASASLSLQEGASLPDAFVLSLSGDCSQTQVSWRRGRGLFVRTSRPFAETFRNNDELTEATERFRKLADRIDLWVTTSVQYILCHYLRQSAPITRRNRHSVGSGSTRH